MSLLYNGYHYAPTKPPPPIPIPKISPFWIQKLFASIFWLNYSLFMISAFSFFYHFLSWEKVWWKQYMRARIFCLRNTKFRINLFSARNILWFLSLLFSQCQKACSRTVRYANRSPSQLFPSNCLEVANVFCHFDAVFPGKTHTRVIIRRLTPKYFAQSTVCDRGGCSVRLLLKVQAPVPTT